MPNQPSHNNAPQRRESSERQCYFCVNNMAPVEYKDVSILRRFVSSYYKIAPRRRSGLCALHQRKVARAVKQSRIAGLMGFTPK